MTVRKKSTTHQKKWIYLIIMFLSVPIIGQMPLASPTFPDYDVNSDGSCNIIDFVLIANHFGDSGAPGWIREDVDKNGFINTLDIVSVSNNYGQSGWSDDVSRIQKLSIAYSNTMNNQNNQEFIANHFDVLDCPKTQYVGAANVKAMNPDITIIGYYDAIFQDQTWSDWQYVNNHESWFVHDINGNRIERVTYPGQFLMNPNSGWSDYCAQQNKQFLQSHPQYDGIFADDTSSDLVDDGYTFKIPYSQFEDGILANWETWMTQYMQTVKTALGNDLIMPNAWKHMEMCEDATHAIFWENFIHGRSTAYNENGLGTAGWNYGLVAIDALHAQAELGNIIAVNSGCKDANSHPVEAKRWMLFTYACFSFAVVDLEKAYFSWQFFNSDSSHGYYPEMDVNLGQPIGDYYHVSGTAQVYARQFTNYYVAANLNLLGTGDVTFTINGASHTLSPRTAVFIEK
jgi:Hypothetical glycosyl hydrolase family 15/Dockerin type I domain